MRRIIIFLILILASCTKYQEVLEFTPQELNIVLVGDVKDLKVDDIVTINNSAYKVKTSGDKCELVPNSEEDTIYLTKEDKNISYSVTVQLDNYLLVGEVSSSIALDRYIVYMQKRSDYTTIELEIPYDVVVSKTLTIKEIELLGVKKTFDNGLVLDHNQTILIFTDPFKIESEGIKLKITSIDGQEYTSTLLQGVNKSFNIGETNNIYVPIIDNFKPCTWPVVFPVGLTANNDYMCKAESQPDWRPRGIWYCKDQWQVKAQWVKSSEPSPLYTHRREFANNKSDGNRIGSIGLKGIWTGDYFEFVFPVDKIEAGTTINLKAPFYGRAHPAFWIVEWLENGQWKSNLKDISIGSYTVKSSFSLKYGGVVVDYSFTLTEAIANDYLRVRIKCADGSLQTTANGSVTKRELPSIGSGIYNSPFYFYCAGSGVEAFTWSIVK